METFLFRMEENVVGDLFMANGMKEDRRTEVYNIVKGGANRRVLEALLEGEKSAREIKAGSGLNDEDCAEALRIMEQSRVVEFDTDEAKWKAKEEGKAVYDQYFGPFVHVVSKIE